MKLSLTTSWIFLLIHLSLTLTWKPDWIILFVKSKPPFSCDAFTLIISGSINQNITKDNSFVTVIFYVYALFEALLILHMSSEFIYIYLKKKRNRIKRLWFLFERLKKDTLNTLLTDSTSPNVFIWPVYVWKKKCVEAFVDNKSWSSRPLFTHSIMCHIQSETTKRSSARSERF